MVWLGRLAVTLVLLLLLAGGVLTVSAVRSLPQLDGQLQLKGLSQPVLVRRDDADVTHIEAASALDAWRALGFVHAQERGWQLEFNRRLMRGELSEILGAATLDTDKLMRTLGIARTAERQFARLPPSSQAALKAYAEGIAQAQAQGLAGQSPEFRLLGVQPEPWTPADSVGWALMMALDLGGNWGNEAARFAAAQTLSTEQLWQLMPAYPGEAPATRTDLAGLYAQLGAYAAAQTRMAAAPPAATRSLAQWSQDWVRDVGILEGKGSNNWVVAGSRSASGKPLVANDPHLALSTPAIWYFARLKAPAGTLPGGLQHPALDVTGATLPGLPFVVLGRTAGVAWGFTNTGPDVQDLYLEALDPAQPGQVRTPQGWQTLLTRQETIRIKGQSETVITVRSSRNGPLISDVQKLYQGLLDTSRYAMALRWAALDEDNATVHAGMLANWAQTTDELKAAYAHHHSPMQSVVMADTRGQVAFQAIGRVPTRSPDNDLRGMAPAPGWLPQYDWTGWLPYEQNPALPGVVIEAQGWHATANQNVLPPGYPHFLGQDWHTPQRYQRISSLLAATDKHDLGSMVRIQHDVLSLGARTLLPHLLQARPQHPLGAQAVALLREFDGQMHAGTAAGLILNVWAHELTQALIAPRLSEARFAMLYGKRSFRPALEGILARDDAFWCGEQGCAAPSSAALDRALAWIEARQGADLSSWRWSRAHPAVSSHRPFGQVAALRSLFDSRIDSAGDLFTVNVGQYWANDKIEPFANRHAASLRAVYDLADPERSMFIYQTGQGGHVLSHRSRDMAHEWANGGYRALQLRPSKWRHVLEMRPE
jgi:penicillin G amidase